MATVIKACTCESLYQDKKYGKGQRVHNEKKSGGQTCTVCGAGGGKIKK